jgi:hypothetical protein
MLNTTLAARVSEVGPPGVLASLNALGRGIMRRRDGKWRSLRYRRGPPTIAHPLTSRMTCWARLPQVGEKQARLAVLVAAIDWNECENDFANHPYPAESARVGLVGLSPTCG